MEGGPETISVPDTMCTRVLAAWKPTACCGSTWLLGVLGGPNWMMQDWERSVGDGPTDYEFEEPLLLRSANEVAMT